MAKRKRRRRARFMKDKSLPTDFSRDYVIALKALSRRHKDAPESLKAVKLLKRMSREAFLAGRGEVWIPNPGSTTGHYPVIENLPFSKVRTALRKNTLRREKAWASVATATRPFYPQHSAVSQMERSLLPAIITSIPFVRGRSPALLGKRVPGELQMTRQSGSIIPIKSMSAAEWTQGGFQPLKFRRNYAIHPALPLMAAATLPWIGAGALLAMQRKKRSKKRAEAGKYEQYGWRERWKVKIAANKKEQDRKLRAAWGWERKAIGKEDLTLAQARVKAKKLSAPGTKITVAKGARAWFNIKKGKGEINVPPHSAAIAHEATHTRQHAKLGRGFSGLYKGAAAAGVAAGATLGMLRGGKMGRFRKMSRWAAPAVAATGQVPKLALESQAAWHAGKEKGGKSTNKMTLGSYYPMSAVTSAGAAGVGHLAGRQIRKEELRATLAHRSLQRVSTSGWKMAAGKLRRIRHLAGRRFALDPIDVLIYEKGFQYGLRSFVQRHRVGEKLKRGALPAALGGLVLEGLRRAHTEWGIPATTVDLVPVQRTTFKGEYAPYTNMQLRSFQNALESKLPGANEYVVGEIRKQMGKIDVEIIGRRAV